MEEKVKPEFTTDTSKKTRNLSQNCSAQSKFNGSAKIHIFIVIL